MVQIFFFLIHFTRNTLASKARHRNISVLPAGSRMASSDLCACTDPRTHTTPPPHAHSQHPPIYSVTRPSIPHASIHLFLCSSIYPSTHPTRHTYIFPLIHPLVHPSSSHPAVHPSIGMPLLPSIHRHTLTHSSLRSLFLSSVTHLSIWHVILDHRTIIPHSKKELRRAQLQISMTFKIRTESRLLITN